MSTLRTFNLQNPDSGTVNIEMDQGGNTLMTGIATVRGAAHFTSTSGSDAVGIGTDITAYKLDVRVTGAEAGLRVYNPDTSSNASGMIRLGNDDNQNSAFLKLNGANNSSTVGGAANLVLGTGTAREVHLATNGTSRLHITSAGQLNLAGNMQFTAATPELEFNNGGPRFRVPAANTLTIHTGGGLGTTSDERLRITSAGDVGIGTAIPVSSSGYASLSLADTSGAQIEFKKFGAQTHYIWSDNNLNIGADYFGTGQNLILKVNGNVERLRINSLGNIGMSNDMTGAGGAYARLTVQMPTQSGGSGIQVANSSNGSGDGTTSNIVLRSVNNDCSQWAGAEYRASDHIFAIQGTEKIRIDSNGRLLINATNNPTIGGQTPYLRVNGGYANLDGLRIRGLDTGNTMWKDGGDMSITVASAHSIYFKTNGATGLQVTANGQVATPLQPRFFATISSTYSTYDGRNVGGTWIAFNNTIYNVGSGFKTSGSDLGRFVAPVSGMYLFHARCYKGTSTNNWSQSWFDLDGSRALGTDWVVDSSRHAENAIQVYMTAGQKIGFHPYNNQTSNEIISSGNHTYFKGCLLG
jgi:hypothetical protein